MKLLDVREKGAEIAREMFCYPQSATWRFRLVDLHGHIYAMHVKIGKVLAVDDIAMLDLFGGRRCELR